MEGMMLERLDLTPEIVEEYIYSLIRKRRGKEQCDCGVWHSTSRRIQHQRSNWHLRYMAEYGEDEEDDENEDEHEET